MTPVRRRWARPGEPQAASDSETAPGRWETVTARATMSAMISATYDSPSRECWYCSSPAFRRAILMSRLVALGSATLVYRWLRSSQDLEFGSRFVLDLHLLSPYRNYPGRHLPLRCRRRRQPLACHSGWQGEFTAHHQARLIVRKIVRKLSANHVESYLAVTPVTPRRAGGNPLPELSPDAALAGPPAPGPALRSTSGCSRAVPTGSISGGESGTAFLSGEGTSG